MGFSDVHLDMGKIKNASDVAWGRTRDAELSGESLDEAYRVIDENRVEGESAADPREGEADPSLEEGTFEDGLGTTWHYVVIDGQEVRMLHVESECAALEIPGRIDGVPVTSIGSDFATKAPACEKLVVPASVTHIEPCAFRQMRSLKWLVLPEGLDTFDASWVRGCRMLEHLELSGAVPKLDASVFSEGSLRALRIGPQTKLLAPGMFQKSKLEQIVIDERNPFLKTDGRALYSADGAVLVALVVPVREFVVPEGVRKIAMKAFYGRAELERVVLPESLEVVGRYSFAQSGIREFKACGKLRRIGERAFFKCRNLSSVEVGSALQQVEADAFTSTAITALTLPASLRSVGVPVATRTKLVWAGPNATFVIDARNPYVRIDANGGLYERAGSQAGESVPADAWRFVRLLDETCTAYEMAPGTVEIAPAAFEAHRCIQRISVPDGVRIVGARAFHNCERLSEVILPDSVERIGDEAFLESMLEALHIPAMLSSLGERALVTEGAYRGRMAPTLRTIDVSPDSTRYFVEDDVLYERNERGLYAILYLGNNSEVALRPDTVRVAPYAFAGARALQSLSLSTHMQDVGIRAFHFEAPIGHLHLDLEQPLDGRNSLDLPFPPTERGLREIVLALESQSGIDPETILVHYDNAILNPNDFDTTTENGLSRYEQAKLLLRRLADPLFMDKVCHDLACRILRTEVEEICVDTARSDDRETFDLLFDAGFVNQDNIDRIIDRVGVLQDAAMTGYLLEAKRRRFGGAAFDFSL